MSTQTPSSGAARHLLPQGEKGSAESAANAMLPSPLAGEGARRAGEGAAVVRRSDRLKFFARKMRHEPTQAEAKLWHLLRNRRLTEFKFRRQQPIDHYIADFVCYSARLIVEADGSQHAESAYDSTRDAQLQAAGFRILRLSNNDILARPDAVLDTVWAALHEVRS
ncbi:MAG: endonuclease domain-containing protein [Devosia sp.]